MDRRLAQFRGSRATRRAALALLVLPFLFACRTATAPTMSVEEARQVTLRTGDMSLVPPPRTITDLTDRFARSTAAMSSSVSSVFQRQSPDVEREDPVRWGRTYWDQGLAARSAGQFRNAIVRFEAAAELIRPADKVLRSDWHAGTWNFGFQILRDLAETQAASGSYWNAIATYKGALTELARLKMRTWPEIYAGLADLYARTGDFKAAMDMLREVEWVVNDWMYGLPPLNPAPTQIAEARAALAAARAAVAEAAGQLEEAERFWRESILLVEPFALPHRVLTQRRQARLARLAGCLLRRGRLIEAELEARRALAHATQSHSFSHDQTGTLTILARILRAQGRYADSEALARAAVANYTAAGAPPASSPPVVAPRLEVAAALAAQGRWSEAVAEYASARHDLADDRLWDGLVVTDPAFLYAIVMSGRTSEAAIAVERAIAEAQRSRGESHGTIAELRGLRAMILAEQGDRTRALDEFKAAARVLLDRRNERDDEVTTEAEQDVRLRAVFNVYVRLLTENGDVIEAFRVAEAARQRAVQRALDASAARAAARGPGLSDLVRREQDAAKQIAALQGVLATALAHDSSPPSETVVRERIEKLRVARRTIVREIAERFPAYAQLVNPPTVTVDQARAALRPGEALLTTLVAEDRMYLWALPHAGALAFAAVPVGEKALDENVRRLRSALDSQMRVLGDIPTFDVARAHELYRELLEPVKAGWARAESLLIVAHGPLGPLPFHALVTAPVTLVDERAPLFARYRGLPWLVRSHAVTTVPSVGALVTLRRQPAAPADRKPFVGFGDPYFSETQAREAAREMATAAIDDPAAPKGSPGVLERGRRLALREVVVSPGANVETSKLGMLPRLPDTADEIRNIARAMKADLTRDVFLGTAANEQTVKTLDLTRYGVIAFATHGLVPGDIDGLRQPALALTAPEVAKIEGDGLLTMEEILALRLDADWVVLSACNTANGAGTGAEAISGLGRAFFYAGARALLVTHWPVETTSARALTTRLFTRYAAEPGLTRAKALQQAMLVLIDDGALIDPQTGKMVFSYAHPIFWAPFALVGDGG
jgi:CHAT domain-containing protein